ncbi:MAG TPA: hypothetical protein VGB93_01455 [Methylovirgula sp.]
MNTSDPTERPGSDWPKSLALGFVFLWFFVGGIAHFAFTAREMEIVPPPFPAHRALVLMLLFLIYWSTRPPEAA